jgi:hypothetical protein
MKAAPIFDALTALHMVVASKHTPAIPHDLWLRAMHAEVGLRQALQEAGLQIEIDAKTGEVNA